MRLLIAGAYFWTHLQTVEWSTDSPRSPTLVISATQPIIIATSYRSIEFPMPQVLHGQVRGYAGSEYMAVMDTNPSNFNGGDLPVENVSWNETVELCRELPAAAEKEYGLPSEAEGKYVCRAGTMRAMWMRWDGMIRIQEVIHIRLGRSTGWCRLKGQIHPHRKLWSISRFFVKLRRSLNRRDDSRL